MSFNISIIVLTNDETVTYISGCVFVYNGSVMIGEVHERLCIGIITTYKYRNKRE